MASASEANPLRVVEDVTCTACGCLCDDIAVSVQEGRIAAVRNACELGRRWFLADHSRPGVPEARIEGRAATREEAVSRAAELLRAARAPLILGLTQCSTETVAAALALADRVGAAVDANVAGGASARLRAMQRVGRVSATLGEVKNRADVVVFWGVDPVRTHPRHFERYSVEPRGRFVPQGRAGRTIIVLDRERTATAERADVFVTVPAERRFEVLWTLRAILKGAHLDADHVARSTGVPMETLSDLILRLHLARYGAWFHAPTAEDAAQAEAILTLIRDLNATTRFVALALGSPGNAAGAEAVTTWQTGIPGRVDLRSGAPRVWPGGIDADVALVVAGDVFATLNEDARARFERVPRIVIAPWATEAGRDAAVALACATPGIEAGGTVTRVDGVVLPLRTALTSRFPNDRQWLEALARRLDEGASS